LAALLATAKSLSFLAEILIPPVFSDGGKVFIILVPGSSISGQRILFSCLCAASSVKPDQNFEEQRMHLFSLLCLRLVGDQNPPKAEVVSAAKAFLVSSTRRRPNHTAGVVCFKIAKAVSPLNSAIGFHRVYID
jgi:hypothetical protein